MEDPFLTGVIVGSLVTSIGELAFSDCSSLSIVALPSTLYSIENYAFSHCHDLTNMTFGGPLTTASVAPNIFFDVSLNSSCEFLFYNTTSSAEINIELLNQIEGIIINDPSSQIQIVTEINVASVFYKTFGEPPFSLDATTNSPAAMTYDVVSGSGTVSVDPQTGEVTIVGMTGGQSTICISQPQTEEYTSASVTTLVIVAENSPSSPSIVHSGDGLAYYLNTQGAQYAVLSESISVPSDLVNTSDEQKTISIPSGVSPGSVQIQIQS